MSGGEESTVCIPVAEVVDTEAEDQRLRDQNRMRDELDRLRQVVDNAEIVTPVVPPDKDVPKRDNHKCGTKGWRWFAGVIGLIVVAVVIPLAVVLPSEPTTPESTTPDVFLNDLLSSISSDGGEALSNTSTPQNKALEWLADDTNLESSSNETIIQRYALATLYYSTNGDSWDNNTLWLDSGEECSGWYGLECTTTGAVSALKLGGINLQGTLPPEIGFLTLLGECVSWKKARLCIRLGRQIALCEFHLMNNLTRSCCFVNYSTDDLSLWGNALEDTIPSEVGALTKLSEYICDGLP
jgi:tetrahydromethanopterin S-methyltransferase subunit B